MRLARLAMGVAVFALAGGVVFAGDLDVQALQAKLAAQEARLNDLQAKIGGGKADAPAAVLSARKNATLKIGGTINTRYHYFSGSVKDDTGAKVGDLSVGDLRLSDAKLRFNIDVNEYFDAYLELNFIDGNRAQTLYSGASNGGNVNVAQRAWIRWKNLCNSGFGVLVGRGDLVFSSGNLAGLHEWGWIGGTAFAGGYGNDAIPGYANINIGGRLSAADESRTTQITPYWESQDGKIKLEFSLFQGKQTPDGLHAVVTSGNDRSLNYGIGSGSARLTVAPIEGLKLFASAINFYARNGWPSVEENNSSAINLGFDYKLTCLPRLRVFGQWTHGWNETWVKDRDSDVVNAGFAYDVTEQLKFITAGEYLQIKNAAGSGDKLRGWAIWPAIVYNLPYGVNVEAGYRYEHIKNRTDNYKGKLHTIYGHLGFNF